MHELPGVELPSGGAGATVPVVLPLTIPTIVTGMAAGKVGGRLVAVISGASPDMPVMVPMAPVGLGAVMARRRSQKRGVSSG
ncbi:hypothetical protein ACVWWO_007400 [Bradyrhizobium sp. F1.13.1]